MSAYKIENLDGGLALIDVSNPDTCEWIDFEIGYFPSSGVVAARVALCDSADSNLFAYVEGAADVRTEMTEWLEDNGYSVSIPCDYRSDDRKTAALREAQALRDRFLGGDYTTLDARYCVWWTSEDKQGSLDCGDFLTLAEAKASLPDMTAELLRVDGGCNPEGILAGTFSIEAVRGNSGCGVEERFDVADFAPQSEAA